MDWVAAIIACTVPSVLIFGYLNRRGNQGDRMRGIGWQYIRFTVISIAIPVTCILALYDVLVGEAAVIISGAMGYAFGQSAKDP